MILVHRLLPPVTAVLLLFSTAACAQPFRHVVPTRDLELPLNEIDRLYLDGQYEAAYDRLLEHLNSNETVSAAQLLNAGLLERLLQLGDGRAWFRLAYQNEPDILFNPWSLGIALLQADSLEQAETFLRKAVKLDDKFGESAIDLARCLHRQGRLDEAENLLLGLVGKARTDGEAVAELAQVYLDRGGYENSEKAARLLEDTYNNFHFEPVMRLWIRLLVSRGDDDQVLELGARYLGLYPKSPDAPEIASLLNELDPANTWSAGGEYLEDAYPGGSPYLDPAKSLQLNRKMRWNAYYGFVKLGELSTETSPGNYRGEPCWVARYAAKSSVPFVSIADTFYAWIDQDLRFTRRLDMVYHESVLRSRKTLETNYDSGVCEIRIWEPSGYWWYDCLPLPPNLFDAVSQLWYTQQLVMAGKSGSCNVSIDHTYERTEIDYQGPDEPMQVLGLTTPMVGLSGILPYNGIAGLTGRFTGWYTADDRALPTRAKFKIFLGSVTLDLVALLDDSFNAAVMAGPATNRPQKQHPRTPGTIPDSDNPSGTR